MVNPALTLEDLGIKYYLSDQSSYSFKSTVRTKVALLDLYSKFYKEKCFRVSFSKEKNIMVADTLSVEKLVSLKFQSDAIIFPKDAYERQSKFIAPHTLFRVIIGYDALSVEEMILGLLKYKGEKTNELEESKKEGNEAVHTTTTKVKKESFDFDNVKTGRMSYKKLPFIIIFNGCDLYAKRRFSDFWLHKIKKLLKCEMKTL